MLPLLLPISALLLGTALMLMGVGLTSTLIAVRGAVEGFGDATLGLIGSAYFCGFLAGSFIAPRLIRRMGHVRSFAFFAAGITTCVILHALHVAAPFWALLRVATGIALLGLYVVIESWLNSHAPPDKRGQIFSAYMAVNLGALAIAQQLLRLGEVHSFQLFAIAAMLVCVALMPVTITRLQPPALSGDKRLKIMQLMKVAPAAVLGAVLSGIAMGAFWSMGAVYAGRLGLDAAGIATFMSAVIVGGAVLQWPLGSLSDRSDRRSVLAGVSVASALAALAMVAGQAYPLAVIGGGCVFGAVAFAVQPVCVAHLIDHLEHDEILAGTAALLLLHGGGSAAGPALAGLAMASYGPAGLPLLFAIALTPLALFAAIQVRRKRDRIVDEAAVFVPMVRTSETVLEMMAAEQPGGEESEAAADEAAERADMPPDDGPADPPGEEAPAR